MTSQAGLKPAVAKKPSYLNLIWQFSLLFWFCGGSSSMERASALPDCLLVHSRAGWGWEPDSRFSRGGLVGNHVEAAQKPGLQMANLLTPY